MNSKIDRLYHALGMVQTDAQEESRKCRAKLESKPLPNWDQEKHETYWTNRLIEAESVANYCFVRQMQINPD